MANSAKGGSAGAGSIKAGGAYVEIGTESSRLWRGLELAEKRVRQFGKFAAKSGAGAFGAGGAILGTLGAAVNMTVDRGTEIGRLAGKLGVSAEKLSAFAYAAEITGEDLGALEGHFENLAERVGQAANGTGEAVETFKTLKINPQDLVGQDAVDQMTTISEAMQSVGNETKRLAMLSQLGGDQFQKLNVLFRRGSVGIKEYMQEARDLGVVLSDDEVKRAVDGQIALNKAWLAAKSLVYAVGDSLLTVVELVKDFERPALLAVKSVTDWIKANGYLVAGLAMVGAALVAAGSVAIAFGIACMLASSIASAGMAVYTAVTTLAVAATWALMWPVLAVGAALAALAAVVVWLGYAWLTESQSGREFGRTIKEVASSSLGNFMRMWSGMKDALKSGDLALAGRIGLLGLMIEFMRWTGAIRMVWVNFCNGLANIFIDAFADILSRFQAQVKSIVDILLRMVNVFPAIGRQLNVGALQQLVNAPNAAANLLDIRDKAQEAERAALEADLKAAEALMAKLVNQANQQAAMAKLGDGGLGNAVGGLGDIGSPLGAFATGGIAKQIFGTGETVAKLHLKVAEDAKAILEQVRDACQQFANRKAVMAP